MESNIGLRSNIQALKDSDSFVSDMLFDKKPKTIYRRDAIYMGHTKDYKGVTIDLSDSKRITLLGKTRSGKTYITRGVMDRSYRVGTTPVVLGDLKPNFYTSIDPIPREEAYLMKNETRSGLPIEVYYPTFFKKLGIEPKMPFDYKPINFSIQDITISDFIALLGINNLSPMHIQFIESIWRNQATIEELIDDIRNSQNVKSNTKRAIINGIENLVKYEVLGGNKPRFVEDINEGKVPILCIAGENSLGDNKHFLTTTMAIVFRQIMDAAQKGILKRKVLIIFDEAPRYCPANGVSDFKTEIIEAVDKGAEWGVSILFTTQSSSGIPQRIFEQSRYLLLPFNLETESAVAIFKMCRLINAIPQFFRSKVMEIMKPMKRYKGGNRDWMLVDTDMKSFQIFVPFSPLSRHLHERKD